MINQFYFPLPSEVLHDRGSRLTAESIDSLDLRLSLCLIDQTALASHGAFVEQRLANINEEIVKRLNSLPSDEDQVTNNTL